jgi:GDP-4-dehydro-6-deoxy-D-mannose reductase
MRDVLERLIALSPARVTVTTDVSRVRPVEIPILYGDYRLLRQRTGWEPRITLEQSLHDVLDEWRQRVRQTSGSSS